MTLPLPYKCMLFFGLWHQLAAEFRMSADGAFVVALVIFFGTWIVRRFTLELAGMPEELTAALIVRGVLWLMIFAWLQPPLVRDLPWSFILVGLFALVLVGFRCREYFDLYGYGSVRAFLFDHSETTVEVALAGLAVASLVHQHSGSVLPMIGYVALIGLPLSFGWTGGARIEPRYDAEFGNEDTFRDAGVSEDN
jgi:hypothetical protein